MSQRQQHTIRGKSLLRVQYTSGGKNPGRRKKPGHLSITIYNTHTIFCPQNKKLPVFMALTIAGNKNVYWKVVANVMGNILHMRTTRSIHIKMSRKDLITLKKQLLIFVNGYFFLVKIPVF